MLLSSQNQRLAALVLLYGLIEFQRDDFDEKTPIFFPDTLPSFSSLFAQFIAHGTDKEAHLLSLLVCRDSGRDILAKYTATQIIKNDAILPEPPSKLEALERLKAKCKGGLKEPFDESRKLEALTRPSYIRPAPPPLMNEDELIWLNPEDFLIEDKKYMYDTNMCETK